MAGLDINGVYIQKIHEGAYATIGYIIDKKEIVFR